MTMELSILIVNYNTRDMLRSCLQSLQTYMERSDVEVIVVDNASHDGSVDMVRTRFPAVRLIASKENTGFVGGNNVGANSARGRLVLLLNSDTELTDEGLQGIIDFMHSTPNAGVVGGKLYFPDGRIQESCRCFPTPWSEYWYQTFFLIKKIPFLCMRKKMRNFDFNHVAQVDWVSGAYMLVRKEIIDKIGLFDSNIFMYYEDTDFCKVVRNAGYEVYFYPGASVTHYHGGSARGNPMPTTFYCFCGSVYYCKKHFGARTGRLFEKSVVLTWRILYVILIVASILFFRSEKVRRKKELFSQLNRYYKQKRNNDE